MKELLHHFFLPGNNNNFRAKLLHHKILFVIILFFVSSGILMSIVRNNYPSVLGTFTDISSQELLLLTNTKRQENNLNALILNENLAKAAENKATDMFNKNYWAHNAPDGTTPWVFIKNAGYNYVYAGENLARGFSSTNDVINAWMASPEHKKNVLSNNFQNVGFAVKSGKLNGENTVLVVEMFGSSNLAALDSNEKTILPERAEIKSLDETASINTLGANQKLAKANDVNALTLFNKPLINSQTFSNLTATMILILLILALFIDMIVIERKKIIRFVGHNLDHLIYLSMILIIIFILTKGVIL